MCIISYEDNLSFAEIKPCSPGTFFVRFHISTANNASPHRSPGPTFWESKSVSYGSECGTAWSIARSHLTMMMSETSDGGPL